MSISTAMPSYSICFVEYVSGFGVLVVKDIQRVWCHKASWWEFTKMNLKGNNNNNNNNIYLFYNLHVSFKLAMPCKGLKEITLNLRD